MADENTPQHIRYQIDAQVNAEKELDALIKLFGRAAEGADALSQRIDAVSKSANQMMGVMSSQQARVMRANMGTIATGGIDAASRGALAKGRRNIVNTDGALEEERLSKAQLQREQARMRLLTQELTKRERLVKLAQEIDKLDRQSPEYNTGVARFSRELLPPGLLMSNPNPDGRPTRPLTGAARTNRAKKIITETAGGQAAYLDDLTYAGVTRTSPMERSHFDEMLRTQKAMAAEETARRVEIERENLALKEQAELIARLKLQAKQLNATDRSVRKNFTDQHAGRIGDIDDPIERNRQMDAFLAARSSAMTTNGRMELEREFEKINSQAERRALKAVEGARLKRESRDDKMRDRADRDNMAHDAHRANTGRRGEEQAINSQVRNNAFNGAGLFMTQGTMLSNFAVMGGLLGSIGFLTSYTVEYEKAMKSLQAISASTKGEMKDLDKVVVDLATHSVFSAQEVADAATVMAQAGLSATQIGAALPAVVNLAVATGTELATTVDIVTSAMTIFDLQTTEATSVANALTAAMNLSKLTMDKFSLGLQYSGNIADTLGIKYNELAAILGGMSDAGIRSGSTLGTGFRQLLLDLQAPTDKAKTVFERLGLTPKDIDIQSQGVFKVLTNLKEAGLTTADATEAFEVRAVAAFKALVNQLPHIEELNQSIVRTEAATQAAGTQMDTMDAQFNRFAQSGGALFYKSTAQIRDVLKAVFGGLADVFGALTPLFQHLQIVTTAVGAFILAWSVIRIGGIIKGIQEMRVRLLGLTAAETAAEMATTRLGRAMLFLKSPMFMLTAALTIGATLFGMFSAGSEDSAGSLDSMKEATSRAKGALDETRTTIEALDTAMKGIIDRYGIMSEKSSPELKSEIESLMGRFAQYGLQLNSTADDITTVIEKSAELRAALSQTSLLQAGIHLTALSAEKRLVAEQAAKSINSGDFGATKLSRGGLDIRSNYATARDPQLAKAAPNGVASLKWLTDLQDHTGGELTPDKVMEMAKDINSLQQRQAGLGQLQNVLTNEKLFRESNPGKTKQFKFSDSDLNSLLSQVDYAGRWMDQVFLAINGVQNKLTEEKFATQDKTKLTAEASPEFAQFARMVQGGKGLLDTQIESGLSNYDKSSGAKTEDLLQLGEEWKHSMGLLQAEHDRLLQGWVDTHLVKDAAEAKALFLSGPLADDYNYLTTATSRNIKDLDPATRKKLAEAMGRGKNAGQERMDTIVKQSRLMDSMDIPVGAIGMMSDDTTHIDPDAKVPIAKVKRRTMEATIQLLDAAFVETLAAAKAQFTAENPHAFEFDSSTGRSKDPAGLMKWNADSDALVQRYKQSKNDIYTNYGRAYQTKTDRDKTAKDAITEELRQEVAALAAELATIKGSVDGQTSVKADAAALKAYTEKYAEYYDKAMALEARVWDAGPYKELDDPELMKRLRAGNMAAKDREIVAGEGKGKADLGNILKDAMDRAESRNAKYRGQNSSLLLSNMTGDASLIGADAAAAKMAVASGLIDSIVKDFTTEFWKNPTNSNKQQDDETKAELTERLSEFLILRTQSFLDISRAAADNEMYMNGQKLAKMQADTGAYENSQNVGRVGSTVKYMDGRNIRDEQTRVSGANVDTLNAEMASLQKKLRLQQSLDAAFVTPGSSEAVASQTSMLAIQERMTEVTKELTAATNEYGAALKKVVEPKWGDLLQASVDSWKESSGAMLSDAQQIADAIPALLTTVQSEMASVMTDIVSHAQDTGDAMEAMGRSIGNAILNIINNMIAQKIVMTLLGFAGLTPTTAGSGAAGPTSAGSGVAGGLSGFSVAPGHAAGGLIGGGIPNRDSVMTPSMPGEFMMKKSAVDFIGVDKLQAMNETGRMAGSTAAMVVNQKKEPDMVNVYLLAPDQKPSMGPKDVIIALADDIDRGGLSKKLIKAVAMGAK